MRNLIRNVLLLFPFFLFSGYMFYQGYVAGPDNITADGYDLRNSNYLLGAILAFVPIVLGVVTSIFQYRKQKRIDDLVKTGVRGQAVVLDLQDTGTRINDNPRVTLTLEVTPIDHPTYKTQKTLTLPLVKLSQVQTGSTIEMLVDPADPFNEKRIAILLK